MLNLNRVDVYGSEVSSAGAPVTIAIVLVVPGPVRDDAAMWSWGQADLGRQQKELA